MSRPCEKGTYHIGEKRRLRHARAFAHKSWYRILEEDSNKELALKRVEHCVFEEL